jgi:phytoene dehydrogenase-like protein
VFAGLPGDAPVEAADVRSYGERVMGTVLTHYPQLRGHLCLATDPATPGGYVSHLFGPVYGWRSTPWEATLGRPDQRTPVGGLILAGHWTRPTYGIMPAVISGCEAANILQRAS